MSIDNTLNRAQIYGDFAGLQQLRYASKENAQAATKEVSQQFEAIFLQIALKNMRTVNKEFSSELSGSDTTEFYQDMFDKQMALKISQQGIGVSKVIFDQLQKIKSVGTTDNGSQNLTTVTSTGGIPIANNLQVTKKYIPTNTSNSAPTSSEPFTSKFDFVTRLIGQAKQAAAQLGIDPKVLLAQAALETGWGKHVMQHSDGRPSYNLFGIKASSKGTQEKVSASTLEFRNNIAQRETADFRSYGSYADSFADYVNLLQSKPRYQQALQSTQNPQQFTRALQQAGYATDPQYANKINAIMQDEVFKNI